MAEGAEEEREGVEVVEPPPEVRGHGDEAPRRVRHRPRVAEVVEGLLPVVRGDLLDKLLQDGDAEAEGAHEAEAVEHVNLRATGCPCPGGGCPLGCP